MSRRPGWPAGTTRGQVSEAVQGFAALQGQLRAEQAGLRHDVHPLWVSEECDKTAVRVLVESGLPSTRADDLALVHTLADVALTKQHPRTVVVVHGLPLRLRTPRALRPETTCRSDSPARMAVAEDRMTSASSACSTSLDPSRRPWSS